MRIWCKSIKNLNYVKNYIGVVLEETCSSNCRLQRWDVQQCRLSYFFFFLLYNNLCTSQFAWKHSFSSWGNFFLRKKCKSTALHALSYFFKIWKGRSLWTTCTRDLGRKPSGSTGLENPQVLSRGEWKTHHLILLVKTDRPTATKLAPKESTKVTSRLNQQQKCKGLRHPLDGAFDLQRQAPFAAQAASSPSHATLSFLCSSFLLVFLLGKQPECDFRASFSALWRQNSIPEPCVWENPL